MVCEPPKPKAPALLIRKIRPSDPVPPITALLHRAYKRLADMGLPYTASYQDDATTVDRMADGTCLLAFLEGRLAGTVTVKDPANTDGSPWYARPDVACLTQFGVEPDLQGRGIGTSLMAAAEDATRALGARHLALDTAEEAVHLIRHYEKRGYAFVEYTQWDKPYRSVVMSKVL